MQLIYKIRRKFHKLQTIQKNNFYRVKNSNTAFDGNTIQIKNINKEHVTFFSNLGVDNNLDEIDYQGEFIYGDDFHKSLYLYNKNFYNIKRVVWKLLLLCIYVFKSILISMILTLAVFGALLFIDKQSVISKENLTSIYLTIFQFSVIYYGIKYLIRVILKQR